MRTRRVRKILLFYVLPKPAIFGTINNSVDAKVKLRCDCTLKFARRQAIIGARCHVKQPHWPIHSLKKNDHSFGK